MIVIFGGMAAGTVRQHWNKVEQLRPVAVTCTKKTKGWVIFSDKPFEDSKIIH